MFPFGIPRAFYDSGIREHFAALMKPLKFQGYTLFELAQNAKKEGKPT
jgi:hypothetical protein